MTDRQPTTPTDSDVTRRRFLRGAVLAGGGIAAATIAACAPNAAGTPAWTLRTAPAGADAQDGSSSAPGTSDPGMSHGPEASGPAASPGMDDHDAAGLAVVKRFLDGEGAAIEGRAISRSPPAARATRRSSS